jgi:aspartate carbamoyltransferase catalytic subunit
MPTAPTASPWPHRHLLQLAGLPAAHLRTALALARDFSRRLEADSAVGSLNELVANGSSPLSNACRGKVVANLFFEDSTRTRVSFSVAARRLGAEVIDLNSVGSSVSKGETVGDTAANISAMGVHAIVMRHRSSGSAHLIVRTLEGPAAVSTPRATDPASGSVPQAPAHSASSALKTPPSELSTHRSAPPSPPRRCSVINAGDGRHEHPTQGLLDILTLAESFDRLETFDLTGLTVAIVGDVGSSRVARSDIAGMTALGARVICIGPPTLVPQSLTALGCEVAHNLDQHLPDIDAVNVLRIQFERHEVKSESRAENQPRATSSNIIASVREYAELYGISSARAARMKPNAIVMHPGPINRGVELTPDVADSNRSMVLRQVTHGVAVRMAALQLCLNAP